MFQSENLVEAPFYTIKINVLLLFLPIWVIYLTCRLNIIWYGQRAHYYYHCVRQWAVFETYYIYLWHSNNNHQSNNQFGQNATKFPLIDGTKVLLSFFATVLMNHFCFAQILHGLYNSIISITFMEKCWMKWMGCEEKSVSPKHFSYIH